MDDGAFNPNSRPRTFSGTAMDLDFIDELLDDGCWLETTDGFNFLQPGLSNSGVPSDPSQYSPYLESSSSLASTNLHQVIHQEAAENNLPGNPPCNNTRGKELTESESQNQSSLKITSSLVQPEPSPIEGSELGTRLWIAPMAGVQSSSSVKQRLIHAIGKLKECAKDMEVLVQIWVPTKKEGKCVLTTIGQPSFHSLKNESLASYRNVSEAYNFPVEGDSKESLGLPGRVFLGKLPESTPDVRFFRSDEYPRKSYAKQYNIRGSLAVPVLERGTGNCLGVVEVITTSQYINYRPELETICKALEAVDLRSSQHFCPPSVKACKEFCQAAVPEISEILGSVCKTHKLPLALTWARCFQQGKGGCRHFDENFAHSISTVDSACFVADTEFLAFHAACSEQYLFLGQGIVGKAFMMNKQCFATDITSFSKTDYPLSHHAKVLDLHAAVAIPLRSTYAGSADFVLELFLPKDCRDGEEQKRIWDLLPIAIQQSCKSLHVVMDKEQEEDIRWQMAVNSNGRYNKQENHNFASSSLQQHYPESSSWITQMMEAQQKGKSVCVSWDTENKPKQEFKVATNYDDTPEDLYSKQVFAESGQLHQNSGNKNSIEVSKNSSFAGQHSSGSKKGGEKRRTKAEKTISLQVLRQYFAGSLKDAAKSIGVCPTTLKRICRQHGITRWPSRKLKKVGHSLKKLQLVIDSVQGAEGTIQIDSFYSTFPELTSPNFRENGPSASLKTNDNLKPLNPWPDSGLSNGGVTASKSPSSSCSRSSGSSICCSTGEKKHKIPDNVVNTGDAIAVEDPSSILKRTRSDAELHALYREEEHKPLARSQSHKILGDHHPSLTESLPPFPKSSCKSFRDSGAFRVKANFGEDKVRFSLQPSWSFKDLQQELAKRFNRNDICRTDLKYLDDDQEWVLLTCDDDLEECKDIYRLSQGQSQTIKISVNQASQHLQ
ncbi:hypothetical protein JCGZ_03094 [Jatropha curcas]|uniref:PB1 domain-containing protein n=1 Tax=Jatropha curcas TaxID=180498 RepID=A0A067L0N8_JATCU|nr:protein NLP2 [Jatropha curcas]XP_012067165.1 protein NLP2 [Jatropha curcas]KDP42031.1 hypothetical protein JCGZ_03094 [Jatropha curcas]